MTTTVVLERDIAAEAGGWSAALHEVEEVEVEVEGSSASDMTDAACRRDDVLVLVRWMIDPPSICHLSILLGKARRARARTRLMSHGRVYKSPAVNLMLHIVLKGCAGSRLPQLKESRACVEQNTQGTRRPALASTCSACG